MLKCAVFKRFFLMFLFLILSSGCARHFTPISPAEENASSLDAFLQNERLGRGINLGNALEAPTEGAWGVTLKADYFQAIADAGFNSVRIPIRWSAHAGQMPPYAIDPDFFTRVDWAVHQALSRQLLAIINIHHYTELMDDPAGHKARFLAIWKQIAEHYKNYPSQLLFEILNEPHNKLTPSLWNSYLKEALSVIRESNPTRTVVIGTASWGGLSALDLLKIPAEEKNVIVTFHYYNPFHFTHQGAEWVSGSDAWLGTTWSGTADQKLAVEKDLQKAADWGQSHNRPIYLGEFGAYSKADLTSRVLWTNFVARQAEARNMSWAYWEFCSGFGAYDPVKNRWIPQLLHALIP